MGSTYAEFCLRVDVTALAHEDAIKDMIERLPDVSYFAFVEFGDYDKLENEHVHAYIRTTATDRAVRERIRRLVGPTARGNKAYSLKSADPGLLDRYERYCCKGQDRETPPLLLGAIGIKYNEDWFMRRQAEYYEEADTLRAPTNKALCGPKLVARLLEICRSVGIAWDARDQIAQEYIKLYIGWGKPINVYSAKGVVNTVSCLLSDGEEGVKWLAGQIAPPDCPNFGQL